MICPSAKIKTQRCYALNGYKAFYRDKSMDVYAATSHEAQSKAAAEFKARKSHQVSVYLCENDVGEQYYHSPADF